MAVIRPFAGIRPCQEKAGKIAALPYDVYNRQEAKKVVEQNPESFLKIDRADTGLSAVREGNFFPFWRFC